MSTLGITKCYVRGGPASLSKKDQEKKKRKEKSFEEKSWPLWQIIAPDNYRDAYMHQKVTQDRFVVTRRLLDLYTELRYHLQHQEKFEGASLTHKSALRLCGGGVQQPA